MQYFVLSTFFVLYTLSRFVRDLCLFDIKIILVITLFSRLFGD